MITSRVAQRGISNFVKVNALAEFYSVIAGIAQLVQIGSHRAVIRIFDESDNVIETHQHADDFDREPIGAC